MNVITSIRDYKSVSQRYDDFDRYCRELKGQLIEEICDKVEYLTQQESFIKYIFNEMETGRMYGVDYIYYINTMAQACNNKKYRMAYDDGDNYDYTYKFCNELMPFVNDDLNYEIDDYMGDSRCDNGYNDFFTGYYISTGIKRKDYVCPVIYGVEADWEYRNIAEVFELDDRFERAIMAYLNMFNEHSERTLEILKKGVE